MSPLRGEDRGQLGTGLGTAASNPHAGSTGGPDPQPERAWVEIESEVLGEHVVVALTREAVAEAQAARPDLGVYSATEIERLHGTKDESLLRAVHVAKKLLGGEVQDRRLSEAIIDEVDGRRPPPNPSVHAMLDRALAHHDRHAAPRLSMTGWLLEHAPEVAALWPEATSQASWFDWECKVGRQHLAKLDEAYAAVLRRCTGLELGQWPQNEERGP